GWDGKSDHDSFRYLPLFRFSVRTIKTQSCNWILRPMPNFMYFARLYYFQAPITLMLFSRPTKRPLCPQYRQRLNPRHYPSQLSNQHFVLLIPGRHNGELFGFITTPSFLPLRFLLSM